MRLLPAIVRIILLFSSTCLFADDPSAEVAKIKRELTDPETHLKKDGPLVIMGNAPLDKADIVFLPEIHDDPQSLMVQLLFIAREKQKNHSFLILDESLASLKKSMWDVFSQKTLEIIAAADQRRDQQQYVPQQFELALQNLASKFRSNSGQLNFLDKPGLWTLADFSHEATPFYGWDSTQKTTLGQRNVHMVSTLKKTLEKHDRILVMAGARHIPELEYLTSKRLLCPDNKFADIDSFFATIQKKYGVVPDLKNGIGATAPIHNFLSTQSYAVVFNKALYGELDRIVGEFKNRLGANTCVRLGG